MERKAQREHRESPGGMKVMTCLVVTRPQAHLELPGDSRLIFRPPKGADVSCDPPTGASGADNCPNVCEQVSEPGPRRGRVGYI